MSCKDRVLDVFVTKDSKTYTEFDDSFVGPVWSVVMEDNSTAVVVNHATSWITWTKSGVETDLEEGDLVRIGQTETEGHTDYCTIVEKRWITRLKSAINKTKVATIGIAGQPSTPGSLHDVWHTIYYYDNGGWQSLDVNNAAGASTDAAPAEGSHAGADDGEESNAHVDSVTKASVGRVVGQYAYRLNFNIDCTTIPLHWSIRHMGDNPELQEEALFTKRHEFKHSTTSTENVWEQQYFPLYKVNKWLTKGGDISISLDHGVKSLHWVKLIGYSIFNKRQVGFQNAHEVISDDWVALHINEIEGGVISNNASANGSFAVLHVGSNKDNETGAIEYHEHDPNGLFSHYFENHKSTIRDLNMRFLDRKGDAAHFGRIHLWFKVCVQHG